MSLLADHHDGKHEGAAAEGCIECRGARFVTVKVSAELLTAMAAGWSRPVSVMIQPLTDPGEATHEMVVRTHECDVSRETSPAKLHTTGTAGRLLGVDGETVRRWAERGWIPFELDWRGNRRFAEADLLAARGRVKPLPVATRKAKR